jgi:hypothetical protein
VEFAYPCAAAGCCNLLPRYANSYEGNCQVWELLRFEEGVTFPECADDGYLFCCIEHACEFALYYHVAPTHP